MKNEVVRCPKCGHIFGFGETKKTLNEHLPKCKGFDNPRDQYGIR
jgi:uncharacterized C2H2 Zn-finger protein